MRPINGNMFYMFYMFTPWLYNTFLIVLGDCKCSNERFCVARLANPRHWLAFLRLGNNLPSRWLYVLMPGSCRECGHRAAQQQGGQYLNRAPTNQIGFRRPFLARLCFFCSQSWDMPKHFSYFKHLNRQSLHIMNMLGYLKNWKVETWRHATRIQPRYG